MTRPVCAVRNVEHLDPREAARCWFRQDGGFDVEFFWQFEGGACVEADVLRVHAVFGFLSDLAAESVPIPTAPAFVALRLAVHRHTLAYPVLVDSLADFHDHTRALMPHDLRRVPREEALCGVHVSPTDTRGIHLDNYVPRLCQRVRHFVMGEPVPSLPGHCLHIGST